jgi:hypothetical protein
MSHPGPFFRDDLAFVKKSANIVSRIVPPGRRLRPGGFRQTIHGAATAGVVSSAAAPIDSLNPLG